MLLSIVAMTGLINLMDREKLSFINKLKAPFQAFFSRGLGLLLAFVLQMVLSRMVGAEGMGIYNLYITWMILIAIFAEIGTGAYTQRTVSVLYGQRRLNDVRTFVLRILSFTLTVSLLIIVLSYFMPVGWQILLFGEQQVDDLFFISAIAAAVMLMVRLLALAFTGLGQVNLSLNVEKTVSRLKSYTLFLVNTLNPATIVSSKRVDN